MVPREWREGYATLCNRPALDGVPEEHWQQFIGDFGRFLNSGWAGRASALGWTAEELFGIGTVAPTIRLDLAGALWLLEGRKIVAIDKDTMSIQTAGGAIQTFGRIPCPVQQRLAWEAE